MSEPRDQAVLVRLTSTEKKRVEELSQLLELNQSDIFRQALLRMWRDEQLKLAKDGGGE